MLRRPLLPLILAPILALLPGALALAAVVAPGPAPRFAPVSDQRVRQALSDLPTPAAGWDQVHSGQKSVGGLLETFVPTVGQHPGLIGALVVQDPATGQVQKVFQAYGQPIANGTQVTLRDRHGRTFTQIIPQHLPSVEHTSGVRTTGATQGFSPTDYVCGTFCTVMLYAVYESGVWAIVSYLACELICTTSGSGSGSGGSSGTGSYN